MDTELAAYLVQPGQRGYDLEALALQYLNKELRSEGTAGGEPQLALEIDDDSSDRALRAQALLELATVLHAALAERDQGRLLTELELPLVPVLVAMEHT